jgi:hypothetical protein
MEGAAMMGMQVEPTLLFYDFRLDDHVPLDHMLRRIDHFIELGSVPCRAETVLQQHGAAFDRPGADDQNADRRLLHGYSL